MEKLGNCMAIIFTIIGTIASFLSNLTNGKTQDNICISTLIILITTCILVTRKHLRDYCKNSDNSTRLQKEYITKCMGDIEEFQNIINSSHKQINFFKKQLNERFSVIDSIERETREKNTILQDINTFFEIIENRFAKFLKKQKTKLKNIYRNL